MLIFYLINNWAVNAKYFMIFAKIWLKDVETCKVWVNQNYMKYLQVIIRDTRINTFLNNAFYTFRQRLVPGPSVNTENWSFFFFKFLFFLFGKLENTLRTRWSILGTVHHSLIVLWMLSELERWRLSANCQLFYLFI